MNWAEERRNILATIRDDEHIEILRDDPNDMSVYDIPSAREIRFRLKPHTQRSIQEMLYLGESVKISKKDVHELVRQVARLEPELLMSLRGIIIINNYRDMVRICDAIGTDEETIPGKLSSDDDPEKLTDKLVGLQWRFESMVIINLHAIRKTANELVETTGANYHTEMRVGFWTTMLHEIRHNQINACIYEVPWLDKSDDREDAVETWARRKYEAVFENKHT